MSLHDLLPDLIKLAETEKSCELMSLMELRETEVDMFTTVFIGSSSTRSVEDRMVTPRGYDISSNNYRKENVL